MPSKAAITLRMCASCEIQPEYPSLVLSNGTVKIIGLNTTIPQISKPDGSYDSLHPEYYSLSYPGFSTLGVEFTAYTAYSTFEATRTTHAAVSTEFTCISNSTRVSLATPLFIPSPAYYQDQFYEVAASPFVHCINTDCTAGFFPPPLASSVPLFTVTLSRSIPPNTLSASSVHIYRALSMPTAIQTYTSVVDPHQSSSASLTEPRKLTIGLVVAIVISIILVTLDLSSFCLVRRRGKRKEEAAVATQGIREDESGHTQMYFQQKVELDDEQRRHEMEAAELRYEMEGEDRIYELPGEDAHERIDRQELRGDEHAKELETSE